MPDEKDNIYKALVLRAAFRYVAQPCKNPVSVIGCSKYYSVRIEDVQAVLRVVKEMKREE